MNFAGTRKFEYNRNYRLGNMQNGRRLMKEGEYDQVACIRLLTYSDINNWKLLYNVISFSFFYILQFYSWDKIWSVINQATKQEN